MTGRYDESEAPNGESEAPNRESAAPSGESGAPSGKTPEPAGESAAGAEHSGTGQGESPEVRESDSAESVADEESAAGHDDTVVLPYREPDTVRYQVREPNRAYYAPGRPAPPPVDLTASGPAEQPVTWPPPGSDTEASESTAGDPMAGPWGDGAPNPRPPDGPSGPFPAQPGYPAGGPPGPGGPFPEQRGAPSSPYPGPGPQQDPGDHPFGPDLSSAQLLRRRKQPPRTGWRRAVYSASGHSINLGESPADRRRRELITRVNQPLQGCYKIAMLSLKGGVGKTTMTATLGSTFASLRGDRVIAVDANPDRGTLSQKSPLETTATVRHLLRDAHRIRKYSDIRAYTSQGPSRLEIVASEQDPAVSEAFSEHDYRRTVTLLEHFYTIMLTDCGTGLMHSAMKGVLELADSLVIVSSGSIDGARSASGTIDWLQAHGFGELAARSVTVINSVRTGAGKVDVARLTAHFAARCRAVVRIPFDAHLEEGAEVDLDQLGPHTRMALLELAAAVADDFPYAPGRQREG